MTAKDWRRRVLRAAAAHAAGDAGPVDDLARELAAVFAPSAAELRVPSMDGPPPAVLAPADEADTDLSPE